MYTPNFTSFHFSSGFSLSTIRVSIAERGNLMRESLLYIEVDLDGREKLTLKELFETISSPHFPSHGVFQVIPMRTEEVSEQGPSEPALEVKDAHSR